MSDDRPEGTSPAYHLVGGGFANMTAHFGVHPLDRRRATKYLAAAVQEGVSWVQAEADIRTYLRGQGVQEEAIEHHLTYARPLLKPWLT